ncbi:MAG: sigma factor, partial [Candidatus Omnitrophota bacterium]
MRMKTSALKDYRWRFFCRLAAVVVASVFVLNTIAWSVPLCVGSSGQKTLQVKSMFKPILNGLDLERNSRFETEAAVIAGIILKRDVATLEYTNAQLKDWYAAIPGNREKPLLEVVADPVVREDSIEVHVMLQGGTDRGRIFEIAVPRQNCFNTKIDGLVFSVTAVTPQQKQPEQFPGKRKKNQLLRQVSCKAESTSAGPADEPGDVKTNRESFSGETPSGNEAKDKNLCEEKSGWQVVSDITNVPGIEWIDDPYKETGRLLTAEEEAALVNAFREKNNLAAQDALCKWNSHLVSQRVHLIAGKSIKMLSADDIDELTQAGYMGFLRALRSHNASLGKLSTYAVFWIDNNVSKAFIDLDPARRMMPQYVREQLNMLYNIEKWYIAKGEELPVPYKKIVRSHPKFAEKVSEKRYQKLLKLKKTVHVFSLDKPIPGSTDNASSYIFEPSKSTPEAECDFQQKQIMENIDAIFAELDKTRLMMRDRHRERNRR